MKVLTVGGGSGGHVTPVVAVIDELARLLGKHDRLQVRFVCDTAFERQARGIMRTAAVPIRVSVIRAGKLRRYKHFRWRDYFLQPSIPARNVADTLKTAVGFLQALWLCITDRPDVVFAKGGYVCLPVGWAARLLRIPIVLHDSDARPGLTNRLLAPVAAAIATGYPVSNYTYDVQKTEYVGVPVRDEYTVVTARAQQAAKKQLGFAKDAKVVLAFGGGLGARSINAAITNAFADLKQQNIQLLLVTGVDNETTVRAALGDEHEGIEIYGFVHNLHQMITAADLVVTRASATALQELAAMKKAVIAVPARQLGDQHKNAEYFRTQQAAVVLSDAELAEGHLKSVIMDLMADANKRAVLAKNIHTFARPDAARAVARLIATQISRHRGLVS